MIKRHSVLKPRHSKFKLREAAEVDTELDDVPVETEDDGNVTLTLSKSDIAVLQKIVSMIDGDTCPGCDDPDCPDCNPDDDEVVGDDDEAMLPVSDNAFEIPDIDEVGEPLEDDTKYFS